MTNHQYDENPDAEEFELTDIESENDPRKLMRYVFFKVDPAWRRLGEEERSLQKKEFLELFSNAGLEVYPYSTVGLRADSDLGLWQIAKGPAQIQAFQAQMNATGLGRMLEVTHSFLAMTKKSMYLKGHTHEGQEFNMPAGPKGSTYLFVYPMDKLRSWYRLDFEQRRKIMGEHFKIGHKYPNIAIHTGYSFGLDDQEFVVSFEGESLGEFSDLVQDLRVSESSAYTGRDVPIFTCVKMPIEQILDQLDGAAAAPGVDSAGAF